MNGIHEKLTEENETIWYQIQNPLLYYQWSRKGCTSMLTKFLMERYHLW